ncbi:MAG: DNA helicase II [Gammaproteobacteria bacterium]|nr:DNA helicase II [Gammaproteobacteria bacterium]
MTIELLATLNPEQRQAVTSEATRVLVLAGAGSGKTRVLVHRVGWLVEQHLATPYNILAVTFTNKAAGEMRGRIEELLQQPTRQMWVGTFHGLAHRLRRAHWQDANLPEHFQILDSEDQLRAIKRILKNMQLDDARWPPKSVRNFINSRKEAGHRARHVDPQNDPFLAKMAAIYLEYEQYCQRSGLVDFAELLLRSLELWRDKPEVTAHYRQRFKHILADEFQDTNALQYAWLQLLAGDSSHLFIVGDDDQSIYGWRGARIENMQEFVDAGTEGKLVRLEQNYRSTNTILGAANALIEHNQERLGKNLWSAGERGDPIQLYRAFNEIDEARYVIDQAQAWIDKGRPPGELAILYRSNAQSRLFEETLVARGIPYRVYGGQRFFERAEIKDALGYLRLLANPADDSAFERVVNHPPRGIGSRTLEILRDAARHRDLSLHDTALALTATADLSGRARNALTTFLTLLEELKERSAGATLEEKIEQVLRASRLIEHFAAERSDKAEARVENLQELVSAARGFDEQADDEFDPLSQFLANAALEAGDNQAEAGEDCLQMMTLHSAKGLEFDQVFMVGVEEGLFPHQRSLEEQGRLEEERRLCYVGITRARKHLNICHAESRRLYGETFFPQPSRFISEIPENYIEEVRLGGQDQQPLFAPKTRFAAGIPQRGRYRNGQSIRHKKFGEGTILAIEGEGDKARIQVNFKNVGKKWLIAGFANLEPSA